MVSAHDAETLSSLNSTQLSSALGAMLEALAEPMPPLAAMLGANAPSPPAVPAARGATAAAGEGIRADELLVRAASRGDVGMVRQMLDHGAVAAARNHYLLTALHWAVTLGHMQVVELLLERGAALDTQDAEGHTPLHMAAREGDEDMVTLLLEKGADPRRRSSSGRTPLELALIFAEDELGCIAALRRAEADASARACLLIQSAPALVHKVATGVSHESSDPLLAESAGRSTLKPSPQMVSSGASLASLGVSLQKQGQPADEAKGAAVVMRKQTLILDADVLSKVAAQIPESPCSAADIQGQILPKQSVNCACGPDDPMEGSVAVATAPSTTLCCGDDGESDGASEQGRWESKRGNGGRGLARNGFRPKARSVEEEMATLVLFHQSLQSDGGACLRGAQDSRSTVLPEKEGGTAAKKRTVMLDFADPFASKA